MLTSGHLTIRGDQIIQQCQLNLRIIMTIMLISHVISKVKYFKLLYTQQYGSKKYTHIIN